MATNWQCICTALPQRSAATVDSKCDVFVLIYISYSLYMGLLSLCVCVCVFFFTRCYHSLVNKDYHIPDDGLSEYRVQ